MVTFVVPFEGGPLDGERREFAYMPCGVFEVATGLYDLRWHGDKGFIYVWREQ